MADPRRAPGLWMRAGLWLAVGVCLCGTAQAESAAHGAAPEPPVRQLSGHFPEKPSLAPSWQIPTEPLGFAPPGPLYLGQRNALASLDFIGEDRLLFTFRVPALLHRTPGDDQTDEREIRAVVLALPSGTVQAETSWMVHDRARYLWMLNDGRFLFRDRDQLFEGDATLKLTPFLHFPGQLLTVSLDPDQQLMVTNSREPEKQAAKPDSASGSPAGSSDGESASGDANANPDFVLRILRVDSGQTVLVSRAREIIHLPINREGYLAGLRGPGVDWILDMNDFSGGSRIMAKVKSACDPELDFVSETEALADACSDMGDDALVAVTTSGQTLWVDLTPDRLIWPLLTRAANGLRFARESLYVSHTVDGFAPLGSDDIKGQWVRIFDAATGNVALDAPANPILDAGGNVAISPSGRRVAVVNGGAIQVFELPAPPPLPAVPEDKASRH